MHQQAATALENTALDNVNYFYVKIASETAKAKTS